MPGKESTKKRPASKLVTDIYGLAWSTDERTKLETFHLLRSPLD